MVKDKTSSGKTGKIVMSAIKKLMKNTGWTSRTIIKFIKLEYDLKDPQISRQVARALKKGVQLGLLLVEKGRYRLSDMSQLVKGVSMCNIRRQRHPNLGATRLRPLRIISRSSSSKTDSS